MWRANACAPRPAEFTTASTASSPLSLPENRTTQPAWVWISRSTLVLKAIAPPRSSRSPCSARMNEWLSTMPVSGECSAATQFERGLHRARRRAVDQREAFDAVGLALLEDRLHLRHFGVFGGDDQLAALAMRHAVRGAELVHQPAAARTVIGAQRPGRVIHAAVDHLAVARRHAVADALGRLGDDDLMALERRRARDRKPHHAGADDQNLHQCDPRSALELPASGRVCPRMNAR